MARQIGCCIYCGASGKDTKLTDEHIVQYSLVQMCISKMRHASTVLTLRKNLNSTLREPFSVITEFTRALRRGIPKNALPNCRHVC